MSVEGWVEEEGEEVKGEDGKRTQAEKGEGKDDGRVTGEEVAGGEQFAEVTIIGGKGERRAGTAGG